MRYHQDGNDFLFRIVTRDESRVHRFTLEVKVTSMEWKSESSTVRNKFKTTPSAGKVLLTIFSGTSKEFCCWTFAEAGAINATRYCDTPVEIERGYSEKKLPVLLRSGVLSLDDNVRPALGDGNEKPYCNSWLRVPTPSVIHL
ncbi:histone-lysine N-methyltransferase SETMAR [Trichonephila clavipes]|nr:histone-lysine N-methyltransferase SETMAR [Trichonephila clavipes]